MIPLTVLRRLDCVLEETKEKVLKEYKKLKAQKKPEDQIESILTHKFKINFYNTSEFTFEKMLGDADGLAKNLSNYIAGYNTPHKLDIKKAFLRCTCHLE
jgi:type I restriction enzyme M protein